jgi:hypothetical protein
MDCGFDCEGLGVNALRNLFALIWLWIKITAVLGAVAFAAGAALQAADPLKDIPYVGRSA